MAIFVWYPKERGDLKMIHDKNDVLTDDELVVVRDLLKNSKHTCLYVRNNVLVDFVLNKNDRRRVKNNYTRETSWTRRSRSQTCCTYEKEKRRNIA